MAPQVGFEVTATNEGLLAVLQQSADAIKGAAAQAVSAFTPVTAAFGALGAGIAAATALLAGGTIFKETVDTTAELARSSIQLGMALGISATRASDLKIALDSVGVTQEQLSGAANAVTRSLREHEEAFARLGVQTRDQSGNYRSIIDIIFDVNAALAAIKDGTERNIEGQRIYGRAWQEVQATLRLTPALMEEAKAHAQSLGLEVGEEQQANFKAYQASMAGVNDVFRAIGNTIGQALMPILTGLGNWFGSIGPGLVLAFQTAIATVEVTFEGLRFGAEVLWETLKAGFQQLAIVFITFSNAVNQALHGDFTGAKQTWNEGMDQVRQIGRDYMGKMVTDAQASHDKIFNALAPPKVTPIPYQPHDKPMAPPETFSQYQQELEQEKAARAQIQAAEGEFHEMSKAEELAYWQDVLAITTGSAQEKAQIQKTIATLEVGIAKDGFSAQLAQLKEQEAAYKGNFDAKLALAKQYAAQVGAAYGTDSKQYADAAKEVVNIEREKVAQMLQIDQIREQAAQGQALAQVDLAEQAAQQDLALHKISQAQMLADERTFENQRFAIKEQTLQQERSLISPSDDPVQYAKLTAQLEALATAHAQKMIQINQQAAKTQLIDWQSLFNSVQSAFQQNIAKMLQGTESFGQGIKNIFLQIGDAILQQLAQIAAHWATTQLANLILGKQTAMSLVQANAGVAGSAALSSFAGAPWPIDVGAPAFAAAMYAEAMSYGLSEKGYDVPPGMMPPLTQLHPKETVLPADLAQGFRDIIRGQGAGGRTGGGGTTIINAIDTKSFEDRLSRSPRAIAKTLRDHSRKRR
jgi:hypothetical protein